MSTMIDWPIFVLYVIASVLFLVVVFWVTWHVVSKSWLCGKCRIRIASIKIPPMTFFDVRRLEVLGDNRHFLGSAVCSKCWEDDLKDLDFPSAGITWWFGAAMEYIKNTPAFLALALSIVSLVLGILNFLQ